MKRSEVNQAIRFSMEILDKIQFYLPDFAYWRIDEWKKRKGEWENVKDVMQGWDVTDFGSGDFAHIGATLFTIRNGNLTRPEIGVPYCEKVIIFNDNEKQVIPLHFHKNKTEDIINRGNGILEIELFHSDEDGNPDLHREVEFFMDGIRHRVRAGEIISIHPGNSITLKPGIYHRFGAKKGAGALVAGEVSKVNDDNLDNVFAEKQNRFTQILEDEKAEWPLVNEHNNL